MIEIEGIAKSFDRPVLRGVNLRVPEGCLYGLNHKLGNKGRP